MSTEGGAMDARKFLLANYLEMLKKIDQRWAPIVVEATEAYAAQQTEARDAEIKRLRTKLTAFYIVLTATEWGAGLGAIAEGDPDVVELVNAYTKRVKADADEALRERVRVLEQQLEAK